jgi:hypothetical protein
VVGSIGSSALAASSSNWGKATLGNHICRRLRKGRCGASLFRVGTFELPTQKPW